MSKEILLKKAPVMVIKNVLCKNAYFCTNSKDKVQDENIFCSCYNLKIGSTGDGGRFNEKNYLFVRDGVTHITCT